MMNMATNETGYGSVEDSPKASPLSKETARAGPHLVKCAISAAAMFGCFFTLAQNPTPSAVVADSTNAELLVAQQQQQRHQSNARANLELPSYLAALDETDPEWDDYSSQLTSRWVVGAPGKGNLVPGQVELVRFVEPHFVFRTYGGYQKASQCGYWWVMDPPKGAKDTYFDHFAICPEWNDATDIIRCRVPVGYVAAVGVGQSVRARWIWTVERSLCLRLCCHAVPCGMV
jgi:hypothetical protein